MPEISFIVLSIALTFIFPNWVMFLWGLCSQFMCKNREVNFFFFVFIYEVSLLSRKDLQNCDFVLCRDMKSSFSKNLKLTVLYPKEIQNQMEHVGVNPCQIHRNLLPPTTKLTIPTCLHLLTKTLIQNLQSRPSRCL